MHPSRLVVLAVALAVAASVACEAADSYVYTARRYDAARACLELYRPVEVVEGPGVAATCPETCIGVGDDVFLTTMCPPLPTIATELAAEDEGCIAARRVSSVTCGEELELDGAAPDDSGNAPDDGAPPAPDLDASAADAEDGA
ncbi:MAG: hypothetical protein K0S65_3913 [Labilithrix sp.]|nr:hypothetical protein [Labilithrix sp.]